MSYSLSYEGEALSWKCDNLFITYFSIGVFMVLQGGTIKQRQKNDISDKKTILCRGKKRYYFYIAVFSP